MKFCQFTSPPVFRNTVPTVSHASRVASSEDQEPIGIQVRRGAIWSLRIELFGNLDIYNSRWFAEPACKRDSGSRELGGMRGELDCSYMFLPVSN